jgi:hypothetical protein
MSAPLQEVTDLFQAEALWRFCVPAETVFDLWEVRLAFHRRFGRPLKFLSGNTGSADGTFLPLCWVEESQAWCFFPGETWLGKTWLEQNRLCLGRLPEEKLGEVLRADYHLRYIRPNPACSCLLPEDETGYLFYPPQYRFRIESWWADFGPRRAKKLWRELDALKRQGVHQRLGDLSHFDLMVAMSMARFGKSSYFADDRFRLGFFDMLTFLENMGLLRVTVITSGRKIVAVDFGCVYQGRYTLLAGGTDAGLPGVAKLINLHHLEWACSARIDEVDFLCGDFSWKPLFHLKPRSLYLLASKDMSHFA